MHDDPTTDPRVVQPDADDRHEPRPRVPGAHRWTALDSARKAEGERRARLGLEPLDEERRRRERGSARLGLVLALAIACLLALAAPALAGSGIGHTRLNGSPSAIGGTTRTGWTVHDLWIVSTGRGFVNYDAVVACSTRDGRIFSKSYRGGMRVGDGRYYMPLPVRNAASCNYTVGLDQTRGYGAYVSVVFS